MLRELAQHCGRADILREQILSEETQPPANHVTQRTSGSTRTTSKSPR